VKFSREVPAVQFIRHCGNEFAEERLACYSPKPRLRPILASIFSSGPFTVTVEDWSGDGLRLWNL